MLGYQENQDIIYIKEYFILIFHQYLLEPNTQTKKKQDNCQT